MSKRVADVGMGDAIEHVADDPVAPLYAGRLRCLNQSSIAARSSGVHVRHEECGRRLVYL